MGMNLKSCCHKCRVQKFHLRGKENETMLPFYTEHYECMKADPSNLETAEDQVQERQWMNDYQDVDEVEEEKSLGDKFQDAFPKTLTWGEATVLTQIAKEHYLAKFDEAIWNIEMNGDSFAPTTVTNKSYIRKTLFGEDSQ